MRFSFLPQVTGTPTLTLTLKSPSDKTPDQHAYCIEAMMYEGALLLAADQVPLAEDDLLAPVVSRAIVTNMLYLQQDDAVKVLITEAPSPYLPLATFEM